MNAIWPEVTFGKNRNTREFTIDEYMQVTGKSRSRTRRILEDMVSAGTAKRKNTKMDNKNRTTLIVYIVKEVPHAEPEKPGVDHPRERATSD